MAASGTFFGGSNPPRRVTCKAEAGAPGIETWGKYGVEPLINDGFLMIILMIILVGGWPTPLKKSSQLGWWNSQYMESQKTCSKPLTSYTSSWGFLVGIEWSERRAVILDDYQGVPVNTMGLKKICRKLTKARFITVKDRGCCKCSLNSVQEAGSSFPVWCTFVHNEGNI